MKRPAVLLVGILVAFTAHGAFAQDTTPVSDSPAPDAAPAPGAVEAPPKEAAGTGTTASDAPSAPSAAQGEASLLTLRDGRGVWTHDKYRYGQKWNLVGGLVLRTLMDLVSIPSGMVAWDWWDWTVTAAIVAATVGLSLPTEPSPDVRIQRGLQEMLGGPDHFKIWTTYGDMVIWMGIWGSVASMFLYGMLGDAPEYVEVSALILEGFAIAQVYHLGIKFLTGREGPKDNVTPGETTGEGRYYGPAGFVKLFPSGTPSGHVATMYAMASVVMHYFNTPGVWIALNTFALLFCVTIIADNYHWASDVILGAALGFAVGRWVVHHRSSRYRNDADGLPARIWNKVQDHVALAPTVMPGGGLGAALVVRF
jgi:membrane-associated phospholipid phosphatase